MRQIPALLIFALAALAQDSRPTLRVEVMAETGPVSGAAVDINGHVVNTGPDGVASATVDIGAVQVRITKEGFFPATASINIDSVREWPLEVELRQQEEREDQITVYATRNDVRLQDSPLHVEVVGQDEINEEADMRPGDIVMLLNEMGGLRVQTTSPSLGAASIRVQGMRGRYTAFLSDGLPLFGQQGAGLGLLQIPPVDLAQVEVIKGNASALYGASAMAGVVNLISRRPPNRPKDEPIHEFLLNLSSLGETDASLFLASPLTAQWGASLLGGGYWQRKEDVNGDRWADVAGYTRGVVRPRFFRDDHNGNTALITGGVTYEDRAGGTMPGSVLPATGQPYVEMLNTRRYDLGGNVQWTVAKRFVIATRFAFSDEEHKEEFGSDDVERDRHDLFFGEASIRGTAGRNVWLVGAAAERDAFRPLDVPRFAYTYVVPGVFAQDDFSIASWFNVSASARLDHHNQYGTFFSPRVSALLRKAGWTSRLSAGQGFFAPTVLTEETEAASLARLTLPAPLRAERGRSASAELTRSMGPVSVTGTLFASNIYNPVYVDRGTAYTIFNLAAPTKNRGAELLATLRKAPFTATASYTYVNATELEPGAGRSEVPLTPRQSFGATGMWEKENVMRVGLECYYTGEQRLEYNPYRNSSAPYVLFGAMAERRINSHMKLFLNLENLGNVRQTHWDPLLLPSRASDGRWTVDAWAPLDGRVINGGTRISF